MSLLASLFDRLFAGLDRLVSVLVGAALLGVTLILVVNAADRSFGIGNLAGGPTLAGLVILWMTFVGIYLPARKGEHITIDMISDRLSGRTLRAVRLVVSLSAIGLCIIMTVVGWQFARFRFLSGQTDQMLFISAGWFYAPLPAGFLLSALAWGKAAADTFRSES